MILESLIQDESRLTLDCAKATLAKGSRIDIPDAFYGLPEVQNAIRLGFCRLVGEMPVAATFSPVPAEPTVWFRNNHESRLSIDCLKKTVMPGEMVAIPQSKMNEVEVANAIAWGMLVDPNASTAQVRNTAAPVRLEELTNRDIIDTNVRPPEATPPAQAPAARQPRQVRASNGPLIEGNNDDDDSMFRPSRIPDAVLDPEKHPKRNRRGAQAARPAPTAPAQDLVLDVGGATATPPASAAAAPKTQAANTTGDAFDFLDIFGLDEKPKAAPAEQPKAPPAKSQEEF